MSPKFARALSVCDLSFFFVNIEIMSIFVYVLVIIQPPSWHLRAYRYLSSFQLTWWMVLQCEANRWKVAQKREGGSSPPWWKWTICHIDPWGLLNGWAYSTHAISPRPFSPLPGIAARSVKHVSTLSSWTNLEHLYHFTSAPNLTFDLPYLNNKMEKSTLFQLTMNWEH